MRKIRDLTYLGPNGTYTQQITEMRFGEGYNMVPSSTIFDACEYVKTHEDAYAIVPIENSSGGSITCTIDILINDPGLTIVESMKLVVRLALLGRERENIEHLYSHFAPFKHCETWIHKNFPGVHCHEVSSTAEAALRVQEESNSAALGSKKLSELYDLNVLEYPIEQDIVNETEFVVLTSSKSGVNMKGDKTSMAVELKHGPGSLCSFLTPFKDMSVNLTRIISRPVYGVPSEYAFYIDIKGNHNDNNVKNAIEKASEHCDKIRIIGSYETSEKFHS